MKIMPYRFVVVQRDGYAHVGECMSLPTPACTAMVRRVPGDPRTLEEVSLAALKETAIRYRWVHYAVVAGSGAFTTDMLRHDWAAPVNFRVVLDRMDRVDRTFDLQEEPGALFVATVSHARQAAPWTPSRWGSFSWSVRPVCTVRYEKR